MARRFCSSLLLLAFAVSAGAAQWYLDSSAGGLNNGTSWANAWASPTSVVWGASGVTAGDTLNISAGSSGERLYSGNLVVGASGSSGNPITIRAGQDSGHNGGEAVLTNGWLLIDEKSFITVDGLVGSEQRLHLKGGSGVQYHAFLKRANAGPILFGGVKFSGTNTTFKHALRVDLEGGVVTSTNPVRVFSCVWSNVWGDAVSVVDGGETKGWGADMLIYSNTVVASGGNGFVVTGNTDIYANQILDPNLSLNPTEHRDGIETYGGYFRIYGNLIRNFPTTQMMLAPFASQSTNWHNVWVFNNILATTVTNSASQRGVQVYFTPVGGLTPSNRNIHSTNFIIANNTIQDFPYYALYMRVREDTYTNTVLGGFLVANNIVKNSGSSGESLVFSDVNDRAGLSVVTNNVSGSVLGINWFGVSYSNGMAFSSGASMPGNVTNAVSMGGYDLTVEETGADLSGYFSTDYDGTARSAPWSKGAQEFVHRNRAGAGTVRVQAVQIGAQ